VIKALITRKAVFPEDACVHAWSGQPSSATPSGPSIECATGEHRAVCAVSLAVPSRQMHAA
jgi:hypothetical protein